MFTLLADATSSGPDLLSAGTIQERRRSRRRCLQEPTEVSLQAEGSKAEWAGVGDLLNLSADGIAVRVHRHHLPETVSVGRTVRTAFQLGDRGPELVCACRVVSVTDGASPDYKVVGMEFIVGARSQSQRERLQAAIDEALGGER